MTHAKGTRLYCLGERKALDVYKHYLADGHDVTINQYSVSRCIEKRWGARKFVPSQNFTPMEA